MRFGSSGANEAANISMAARTSSSRLPKTRATLELHALARCRFAPAIRPQCTISRR
jgi:hypothetical protein